MDKNQSSKTAAQCKIEVKLLDRHKKQKNKLSFIKVKKIKAELDNNLNAPVINAKSKRLASKSATNFIQSDTRLKKTHEVLKKVNMLPKKVKLSLSNLKCSNKPFKILSKKLIHYDQVMKSPKQQDLITFPSLENLTDWADDSVNEVLGDISRRNKLILSLKSKDLTQEEPKSESLSFSERSRLWVDKKNEKVKSMKKKIESLETESCTFRPQITSRSMSKATTPRNFSTKSVDLFLNIEKRTNGASTSRSIKDVSSYKNIMFKDSERIQKQFNTTVSSLDGSKTMCPISMNISYSHGYSPSLKKNSKPLINYNVLNVRI